MITVCTHYVYRAVNVRKSKTFHGGKMKKLGVPKWKAGDTVGCAADLAEGTIMFGMNFKKYSIKQVHFQMVQIITIHCCIS